MYENCAGWSQYYNSPLFTPLVCYLRVHSQGTGQIFDKFVCVHVGVLLTRNHQSTMWTEQLEILNSSMRTKWPVNFFQLIEDLSGAMWMSGSLSLPVTSCMAWIACESSFYKLVVFHEPRHHAREAAQFFLLWYPVFLFSLISYMLSL